MKKILLLCLIGLAIDHQTVQTEASSIKSDENQIINQGKYFDEPTRFKRGAAHSRPTRRTLTTFGSFFGAGRDTRLCNIRLNTARIENIRSNRILDLVIMRETKDLNDQESSGLTVHFFEEYNLANHGQVNANKRLRAYHFPYLSGRPGAIPGELGVGWVDIPKNPTRDQPRLAITGGMNGCATIVMSLKNDISTLRVYHLQSPETFEGPQWNAYIQTIKNLHNDVDNVVSSFSWEDYGYDAQTQESFRLGHRGLQPEATILLHYDSGRQKWYYASQLNMNPRAIFDKNNKKIPLTNMNDAYLNGKTYKTLYAQLTNERNRPASQFCNNFFSWV